MLFDWDDANLSHIARHGVTAVEVEEAVNGFTMELDHYEVRGEERQEEAGETRAGRVLFFVTTPRNEHLRVVTAYDATRAVKLQYFARKGLRV